ncbi:UNVERIFIED_CONTAM: hypothetical protein HDU68_008378 [Siphonaria sp. JEL0065]|nr:hypothetical protein HDU68_008378 [Siphonaria sp. JEL0065]
MAQLYQNMDYIVKTASMRPEGGGTVAPTAGVDVNVKDRYRVAQEHQKALGASSNIIHTAETLLGLTAALKQQLLLNDFATLDAGIGSRVKLLSKEMEENNQVVEELQKELEDARRTKPCI